MTSKTYNSLNNDIIDIINNQFIKKGQRTKIITINDVIHSITLTTSEIHSWKIEKFDEHDIIIHIYCSNGYDKFLVFNIEDILISKRKDKINKLKTIIG